MSQRLLGNAVYFQSKTYECLYLHVVINYYNININTVMTDLRCSFTNCITFILV